jgi:hypothetical protein
MHRFVLSVFLSVAVALPTVGIAQVYQLPTPPPQVTAAGASWQAAGEPVFYAGAFYYPAGATVYFDGDVMKRTGVYMGVPLYEDATVEPYSIVYVPIGRNVVRPYERRREGDLAGTAGSRTPSFPIQRDVELSAATGRNGDARVPAGQEPLVLAEAPRAVGTAGQLCCYIVGTAAAAPAAAPPPAYAPPTAMQSIPAPPGGSDGVWILFDGQRWYSDGAAVTYDVNRFAPVGNYRGFPVYRENAADTDRIFVTVVPDGPVAPFVRR